jgi:hypothetical protein
MSVDLDRIRRAGVGFGFVEPQMRGSKREWYMNKNPRSCNPQRA